MIPDHLVQPVAALLRSAGFAPDFAVNYAAAKQTGGRNNQVFKLSASGKSAALKVYFRHPSDPRDRLGAEFAFASFAWNVAGTRALPRPLAADFEHGLGLYEFVEGRKLDAVEIDAHVVDQAVAFIGELNAARATAADLPLASEASFTVRANLDSVDARIARCHAIEDSDSVARAAKDFVAGRLDPAWRAIRARIADAIGVDDPLPQPLRCVSPSDFGFHNAILATDGTLRFIDFEYAGWDDPARLIGDFFNQVERPAPRELLPSVVSRLAVLLGDRDAVLERRAALLLPLFAVKWCCILLNEFLPIDRQRRVFAADLPRIDRATQLEKARASLTRLVAG